MAKDKRPASSSKHDDPALILGQFRAAWDAGKIPKISSYLPKDLEKRRVLLPQLISIDLERQLGAGKAIHVEQYLKQYPEVRANRRAVVELIMMEFKGSRRTASLHDFLRRFPEYSADLGRELASAPTSLSDVLLEAPGDQTISVQPEYDEPESPEEAEAQGRSFPTMDTLPPLPPSGDLARVMMAARAKRALEEAGVDHTINVQPDDAPDQAAHGHDAQGHDTSEQEGYGQEEYVPEEYDEAAFPSLPTIPPDAMDADSLGSSPDALEGAPDRTIGPEREDYPDQDDEYMSQALPTLPTISPDAPLPPRNRKNLKPTDVVNVARPGARPAKPSKPVKAVKGKDAKMPMPKVIGYEILSVLGRGGMGVVYKARQAGLNRLVALKMVLAGAHAGESELARFRAEAEAVARLQHPNIVQIYDIGAQDNQPYFSLEYIDGGSLEKRLVDKPLSLNEAAEITEQLARAMQFAHERNIIHRDLKPANILLTRKGEPKITDFGLAKQLDTNHGNTRSGAIMGTPNYMSPEQACGRSKDIGPRSDLYSLGALLYEMLSGRPPFVGETAMDIIIQVVERDPTPPSRLRQPMPRDLEIICLKCLAKEPRDRYATTGELADDLRRFLQHEPILARPVSFAELCVKWIKRRPMTAAFVGMVLLSVLGAMAVVVRQQHVDAVRLEEQKTKIVRSQEEAETAKQTQAWVKAATLLEAALRDAGTDPRLSELRDTVSQSLRDVKAQQNARDVSRLFSEKRDRAIFYATLSAGEREGRNLDRTRTYAREALNLVAFPLASDEAWTIDPAFTDHEKTEIREGCYELLLTLSDTMVQSAPLQAGPPRQQRFQEALTLLDRAEKLGFRTGALHLRRERFLGLIGQEDAARRQSAEAKALEKQRASWSLTTQALDHYLMGEEFYKRGDISGAQNQFAEALRLQGDYFWARYFLALCYIKLGQSRLAIEPLTQCLQQKQGLTWIYLMRGFAYGQINNFSAAESDFRDAEQLSKNDADVDARYVLYNNRAIVRVGQNKFTEAIRDLNLAIQIKPLQYQAYVSLALVHFRQKQPGHAMTAANQAIEKALALQKAGELEASALGQLYRARARFQLATEEREAALADLDKAISLEPPRSPLVSELRTERGRLLQSQNRHAEAVQSFKQALASENADPEISRRMAQSLLALQRYDDTIRAYNEFAQRGGTLKAHDFQGRALAKVHMVPPKKFKEADDDLAELRARRFESAIDDLTQAINLEDEAEIKIRLLVERAQLYLTTQAWTLARYDYDKGIDLQNKDPKRKRETSLYMGRGFALVKLNNLTEGIRDTETALTLGKPTSRLAYNAARAYAQADALLSNERATTDPKIIRRQRFYEERAQALLRESLALLPAQDRRTFWREQVLPDQELIPIRRTAEYLQLERQYGGVNRTAR